MGKLENTVSEASLFQAKWGREMTEDEWIQFNLDGNWDFMQVSSEEAK